MKTALNWIISRLKEDSTWRGIVSVTTGIVCLCTVVHYPMFAIGIAGAGQTIVGFINTVRNSTDSKP